MAKAIERNHGKAEHVVHFVEFKAMLDAADMTHEDAALIFNVTSTTIRNWLRTGPEGPAAHFIGYMLAMNVPPRHVADILRLTAVSNIRRSSTKAGDRSKTIAKASGKNKVEELSARTRALKYLFLEPYDGSIAAIAKSAPNHDHESIKQAIDILIDQELVEFDGKNYSLSPFAKLKMADGRAL